MKQFLTWGGLGFGLALGGGMVYAFYLSEAMRLAAVGIGAFMLAALTIGGTALAVNRQWTNTLGTQQAPHIIHNHRYPVFHNNQPHVKNGGKCLQNTGLKSPLFTVVNVRWLVGHRLLLIHIRF
jgi:hypothetical protein